MQERLQAGTLAEEVVVTGGTGRGSTRLTAFDAALQDAGIHEANLIPISSIIPASADIRREAPPDLTDRIQPGAYIPAVYAWEASDRPDASVHAAVAGTRLAAGHGINVEDHGVDAREADVRARCRGMLQEMADRRGSDVEGDPWMRFESITPRAEDGWSAAVAAMLYTR